MDGNILCKKCGHEFMILYFGDRCPKCNHKNKLIVKGN